MKATKEEAANALHLIKELKARANGAAWFQDVLKLEEFVLVAAKRLPSEAAVDRDRAKKRTKAK